MKKQSQSLLFAVAAFALTATSVQAFGNQEFLTRAGLSDEQVIALQEARELRQTGDLTGARDALLEAGIDEDTINELRNAHREYHGAKYTTKKAESNELLTEDQKAALQVAQAANDKETVRAIFAEVGIDLPEKHRIKKMRY